MTFSIVVPVYNAERYLAACAASVTAQTEPDWELILVDDGSAGECARLCDGLADTDERIRALHKENGGPLLARLSGIAEAKGDYVLFLDADDALRPACLRTLRDAVVRHGSPDMLIYSFDYEDPDGAVTPAPKLFSGERAFSGEEKRALYEQFLAGTLLNNVWTKAVKRAVFSREAPDYAPFASLRCAEDRLLSMVWTSNAASVVYLPERLYRYRRFPGSVTRQYSPEAVKRFNSAVLYPTELDFTRRWGMPREAELRLQAGYVGQAIYALDRFYRNASSRAEREKLAAYPWETFVPEACVGTYRSNPYLNDAQIQMFSMMLAKDAKGLERHFTHKRIEKRLRELKKSFSLHKRERRPENGKAHRTVHQ